MRCFTWYYELCCVFKQCQLPVPGTNAKAPLLEPGRFNVSEGQLCFKRTPREQGNQWRAKNKTDFGGASVDKVLPFFIEVPRCSSDWICCLLATAQVTPSTLPVGFTCLI